MDTHELTRELKIKNSSKIVLTVVDGLGGLPQTPGGRTELETASSPNLDELAKANICGLMTPTSDEAIRTYSAATAPVGGTSGVGPI